MKMTSCIILLFLTSIYSFTQNPIGTIFDFPVDSLEIKPQGIRRSIHTATYGNRNYFLNLHTYTLDYFDFEKKEHIILFDIGEGLINITNGIGVLSPDSIIFLTFEGIKAYDSKGYLLYEHPFKKPYPFNSGMQALYSPLLKTRYGYLYENRMRKKDFDLFNPKSGIIRDVKGERDCEKKGLLCHGFYEAHGDTLAILYQYSPDVQLYDLRKKKRTLTTIKSNYDTGFTLREGTDDDGLRRHWVTNGFYYKIMYHPAINKWTLFYYHPQPFITESGDTGKLYANRHVSMILMDDTFKVIKEYLIPPSFYVFLSVYPCTDGLIFKKYKDPDSKSDDIEPWKFYRVRLE